MTPEELNRTIQFIVEHQAQFAIQMEQLQSSLKAQQASSLDLRDLTVTMSALVQLHSRRLDRHDPHLQEIRVQNDECLARLDLILSRLKPLN